MCTALYISRIEQLSLSKEYCCTMKSKQLSYCICNSYLLKFNPLRVEISIIYLILYDLISPWTASLCSATPLKMRNNRTIIYTLFCRQDGFPITTLREIAVLKKCRHPNIVDLLDVVVGKKRDGIFLVFEYCEHDLEGLLSSNI